MTDGFDLRALIREVSESSPATDPATLAKEVGKRIGRNQERTALDQALPILVQHVVSRSRDSIPNIPGGQSRRGAHTAVAARGNTSRKVAGIRDAWQRTMRSRIAVGDDGAWKFLGDCTTIDLDWAAAIREQHARSNAEAAARLRRLAELLDEHGVETVAELPPSALDGDLGGLADAA